MSDLMEYIKVQWDDIHHSRNQEWRLVAILGGILWGLSKESLDPCFHKVIAILGLVVSSMGIYTSYAHWKIFYSKRKVIAQCERALGIYATLERAFFPVQGIMISVYVLLASFFFGWLIFLFTANLMWLCFSTASSFLVGFVIVFRYSLRARTRLDVDDEGVLLLKSGQILDCRKGCGSTFPEVPLCAELENIQKCIELLGRRALKLVSNECYKDETPWEKDRWSFTAKEDVIVDKKVLLNPKDVFQFSVASQKSVQDFHKHEEVVEIFVSDSRMKTSYGAAGREDSLEVSKGVLIVPPNVRHKVELDGLTFVFQGAARGGTVHGDKQPERAR